MCVIAGYIGKKRAAPILMEMLRKEEGLDAGFYTGIATIDQGKLHYRKVVGDIDTFLAQTDAMDLPGTIGIAHSRTPSGGGREWGHPFMDASEQLAYIANGSRGRYVQTDGLAVTGNRLLQEGVTFKSAQSDQAGNPPKLPILSDGTVVHVSDMVCQLIAYNFQNQDTPESKTPEHKTPEHDPSETGLLRAVIRAFEEVPSEIVGLCIHAAQPDSIVIGRHNQPMQIGRGADGSMYLATTTMAFPQVQWQMRMAPLAGAICHRDGTVRITPFGDHSKFLPLGAFPSSTAVMERVEQFVKGKNPCTMPDLSQAIDSLWPSDCLRERAIVIYELLAALHREGRITLSQKRIPGMFDQGTVPRTFIEFKK